MKSMIVLVLTLAAAPVGAWAMPVVGDVVGTSAEAAKAALAKAGCPATRFEAEDGTVEAICTDDSTQKAWDISIDPKTGAILDIKTSND